MTKLEQLRALMKDVAAKNHALRLANITPRRVEFSEQDAAALLDVAEAARNLNSNVRVAPRGAVGFLAPVAEMDALSTALATLEAT